MGALTSPSKSGLSGGGQTELVEPARHRGRKSRSQITDRVTVNVISLCDFVLDTPGFGRGYTCSLAGMSSLGRSGRCIHTAETRPTGRSHGKSRRVSQKTDPRKNRARRRNRPGNRHGKPHQKPYGKPRSGVCFIHENARLGSDPEKLMIPRSFVIYHTLFSYHTTPQENQKSGINTTLLPVNGHH